MEIISRKVSKNYIVKDGFFKRKVLNILSDIDLEIKQGEIIGFMGEKGEGKSTLVKILSGRVEPTSGEIIITDSIGCSLKNNCELIESFFAKKLNVMDTVYNNLVFFGSKLMLSSVDIEKKIVDLKTVLEFDKIINKKVNELEKLDLIKVNTAIYLLNSPNVLFVDGALKELDIVNKNIILKALKRINKESKVTIVIASDEIIDIEKICKRVIFIKKGKIVIDDNFENIKEKYLNNKVISILFNKSFNLPKGDFKILENSEYSLLLEVDFRRFDFASLINQFDINTIVDININCPRIGDMR